MLMIAILRKKKFSTEKRGKEEEREEERVLKYNKSRQIFYGMEKKRRKIKNDVYRLELMCDENPPSRTHFDRLLVSKKYKQFNPAQMDPPAMEFRI